MIANDVARVSGMLLGGALGDALGNPVEFLNIDAIRAHYGASGITDLVRDERGLAVITDDTQMTLFTLEGLIRAHRGGSPNPVTAVHAAYLRWLHTQNQPAPAAKLDGWLITHPELFARRAPGYTCLSALSATARWDAEIGSISHRLNSSKGCGAVMRAAPVGLWPGDAASVFALGVDTGALTHSHASGYLAAGALAVLTRALLHGVSIAAAIDQAVTELRAWLGNREVLARLDSAVAMADRQEPMTPEVLESMLGGGWVAEEALAIAVNAALRATDFADGVRIAVNHSGDSDSTGAIAGNILGTHLGRDALPQAWLPALELRDAIEQIARDAVTAFGDATVDSPEWTSRYPAS
jgi:ADP-ribosylglycohydrolase